MVTKFGGLMLAVLLVVLAAPCGWAQVAPEPVSVEPGDGPPEAFRGPPPGMERGHPGRPGMKDKAFEEKKKKMGTLMTTAEAYKNLASMYRDMGKTDEAIAQLKKILELANSVDDEEMKKRASGQIGRVYMEIAEILLEKDRLAEAETILNEGVEKIKGENPEVASRLILNLGNLLRKMGKTAEAERAYKRVIDLNSEVKGGKK